jgi:hypothetical protein
MLLGEMPIRNKQIATCWSGGGRASDIAAVCLGALAFFLTPRYRSSDARQVLRCRIMNNAWPHAKSHPAYEVLGSLGPENVDPGVWSWCVNRRWVNPGST